MTQLTLLPDPLNRLPEEQKGDYRQLAGLTPNGPTHYSDGYHRASSARSFLWHLEFAYGKKTHA